MGALSGVLPFVGVTVPFVGRSGTALVASFAALALIMLPGGSTPHSEPPASLGPPAPWRRRLVGPAGLPAAFALVLASLGSVQLAGRSLAPATFLEGLPRPGAPLLHAQDPWSALSYRQVPGPIVDRRGRVLSKSTALGGSRVYPDAELAAALGPTLVSLEARLRSNLAGQGGRSPPVARTLVTTLDADLQEVAHHAFDAGSRAGGLAGVSRVRGATVVVDVRSGDILALESRPTFSMAELSDPRAWSEAESADRQTGLPYRYLNRVVHGYYPPGSIFKVITAGAVLATGRHTVHSRDFDYRRGPAGPLAPDGVTHLGLWHRLQLGDGPTITDGNHPHLRDWTFDLEKAFAWSCNIAFAQMGIELGPSRLVSFARRFGFERVIDVPGLGTMNSTLDNDDGKPASARYLGRTSSNLARTAFGQAQVRVTPLQMALVAAAVANRGRIMQPHMIAGRPKVLLDAHLGRTTADGLPEIMQAAATHGVASGVKLNRRNANPGVAGKTGSAEWSDERDATHSWFIGYYPAEAPRVALATVVERGGLGSAVAVRIARRIFASPALRTYLTEASGP
jgi:penicillin-binding protein A